MTDYINREDAIKAFDPKQRQDWYTPWIVETLKDLPPGDVAPVRHGSWVDKGTITDEKAEVITEWQSARCTCCNKYHTTPYLYYFDNFAYCPNCGARMDGEDNDI